MDVIDAMTLEEQIQVKEEAQRLLRSVDLKYEKRGCSHSDTWFSRLTVHTGDAQFDFYPAEILGSARKRATKKKAELRTTHDTIGLTSQV